MLCLLECPSQPVNFNVTSEDDTLLMLTWSEPENTKGGVDYYIVSTTLFLLHVTNIDILV